MAAVLPLEDVVKIIVNLSPRSAVRNSFNLALIVGTSEVISTEDRVRVYSSTDSMLDDGFKKEMPEYQLAALYFMQSTSPSKLAVGRWDDTTPVAPAIGQAGDDETLADTPAEKPETLLDAIIDCRAKNRDWYICVPISPTSDQVLELAGYIESVSPVAILAYTTKEIELLQQIKAKNYRRSFGQYSMRENAVIGIIGWAMGANTGLRNSAYTLAYKRLVGIEVDDFDENTVAEIQKYNGNYYINRGAQYDLFERGTMGDGVWFDEIINLDMLVNDLQLSIMDLISTSKKVPQTEGGVNLLKTVMRDPLEKMVRMGFIAGGIWKGPAMLNLEYGNAIENGYLIMSEPVAEQSQADRDARLAPPIYVALKLAGAIHTVVIQIDVNR